MSILRTLMFSTCSARRITSATYSSPWMCRCPPPSSSSSPSPLFPIRPFSRVVRLRIISLEANLLQRRDPLVQRCTASTCCVLITKLSAYDTNPLLACLCWSVMQGYFLLFFLDHRFRPPLTNCDARTGIICGRDASQSKPAN